MKQWIVTAQRYPLNYNKPTSYIVEAESDRDAKQLVRLELRDLGPENYQYKVRQDDEPRPAGRIIGGWTGETA